MVAGTWHKILVTADLVLGTERWYERSQVQARDVHSGNAQVVDSRSKHVNTLKAGKVARVRFKNRRPWNQWGNVRRLHHGGCP